MSAGSTAAEEGWQVAWRGARATVALALLLAATPAAAFKRTEAVDASGAVQRGRCLWWAGKQVTFTVNVPAAANVVAGCGSIDAAVALVRESTATWSAARRAGAAAACTDFHFVFGGSSASTSVGYARGGANENLIVFRHLRCDASGVVPAGDACLSVPGACMDKYNCWERDHGGGASTIALTTTSFDASTGEIVDADMELFDGDATRPGFGYWFTCRNASTPLCPASGPTSQCSSMDLGSTVTHESGHMLGLAHNCSQTGACDAPDATMFPSASVGEITKRVLKADDVEGVCTIYPAGIAPSPTGGVGESGVTCAAVSTTSSASTSSGGCATAGAGPAGLLLAVAALARRRLRRR